MDHAKRIFWVVPLLLALALMSCGRKAIKEESVLDRPDTHYSMGMRLLEQGKIAEANREFERASQLAPDYPEAYAGMALAAAKNHDFKTANKMIDKALGKDSKNVEARIIKGRIISMQRKGDDWVKKAVKEFERALKQDPNNPKAYFFMGMAYKRGFDFDRAAEAFSKVIAMKDDYAGEANKQWEIMQKIQRAAPGTRVGKEIAIIDEIDRADLAVLLIEEMKLPEVIQKRRPRQYDTSYQAPEDSTQMQTERLEKMPAMTDVADHWAKSWIEQIVELGVMEPFPDHTFRPDEKITRSNYAQVMQQILIMATGDPSLATKYVGEKSRFPDVNSSHYAYNAMALSAERGILKADTMTGEFRPQGHMSGADALLAIREFQNALRLDFK